MNILRLPPGLTLRERALIVAALYVWRELLHDGAVTPPDSHQSAFDFYRDSVATDDGKLVPMNDEEIEALIEKLPEYWS